MALEIGSQLGPYKVTAKIGEGGMGEVFEASSRDSILPVCLPKTSSSLCTLEIIEDLASAC